jgi:hypothetical protein
MKIREVIIENEEEDMFGQSNRVGNDLRRVTFQQRMPSMVKMIQGNLDANTGPFAKRLSVNLGADASVFRRSQEIFDLANHLLAQEVMSQVSNILMSLGPAVISDEDELNDALTDLVSNIRAESELWNYIEEVIGDDGADDEVYACAMTIEGEIGALLIKVIQQAYSETKLTEQGVAEDYDQTTADTALQKAMINLATTIKPRIYSIVSGKKDGKNITNFARSIYSDAFGAIYAPYLRQSFNTPDTKAGFDNNQIAELIKKYASTKTPGITPNLDTAGGWCHFYRNDRPPSGTGNKKFYQNINLSADIKQLDQMVSDLIKYLGSDDAASTGFFGFKIPTADLNTEADPIVSYFSADADPAAMSMGQSVISNIAGRVPRVAHRGSQGTDNPMFKSKHFDNARGGSSESDSSMLINKFAEYLVDNADKLYQYYETYKNDMNMMGKILVKTWKEKFEKKDWTGLAENFHDGRHPEDKGDSKRHGVPTKASISTLRKVAKQGGRKGQLAHWMANMKSGRAKAKK